MMRLAMSLGLFAAIVLLWLSDREAALQAAVVFAAMATLPPRPAARDWTEIAAWEGA